MSNFSYNKLQSKIHSNVSRWVMSNSHLDPRLMTLRIDEIILSKDLSLAKVKCYHKVEIASLLKILNANRFSTQKHIKDTLEIRRIPKIKFIESPAYTKQQELEKVLNEIATD